MRYYNTSTGSVIDVVCHVSGGDWVPLEEPKMESLPETKPAATPKTTAKKPPAKKPASKTAVRRSAAK